MSPLPFLFDSCPAKTEAGAMGKLWIVVKALAVLAAGGTAGVLACLLIAQAMRPPATKAEAVRHARDAVQIRLRPQPATFADWSTRVASDGDRYQVRGHVDTVNNFNAPVRCWWTATVRLHGRGHDVE